MNIMAVQQLGGLSNIKAGRVEIEGSGSPFLEKDVHLNLIRGRLHDGDRVAAEAAALGHRGGSY